ncbi:hypothetical protein N8510_00650 [bacterium]|nr:hypothetical protein [bacterium]
MWVKSWEFVSVVGAALWCLGLSAVGVAQFSLATYQPETPPPVAVLGWSEPESSSSSPEDDLARRVELNISPPFGVPTTVKLRAKWNDQEFEFERLVPMEVERFKVGFDLGPRGNLYADELVECFVETVPGQSGQQAVHQARFPGMPNRATLNSSAAYLQGGVQESLEIYLELQGRVEEDVEFPLTLKPDKGLVTLDSKSLLVRKGQRVSEAVKVKVVNTKVNDQLTAVATKPDAGIIEMREDSVTIELLAKPKPVVSAELTKNVLEEGVKAIMNFSLAMADDEDLTLSIQIPPEYQSDLELSETEIVIPAGAKAASLEVLAVADNVIREPDENVSLKVVSEVELEISGELDLTVKDNSSLDVVLATSRDAKLSEGPANQEVEIELALADGSVAGTDIVIPCKVIADTAKVVAGKEESGDDVVISGIGPVVVRRVFNAENNDGSVVIKKGQNATSIKLRVVDDRVFMEEESVTIEFDLKDQGKFVDADGGEVASTLSYEIQDNDTTLLKPLEKIVLKEGVPLEGGKIDIATVECDVEKALTFSFVVESDSTAKEGVDYRLPEGNKVTLQPGDVVLSLPLQIENDEVSEPAEELRLLFDDPELGSVKISLSDDDDPNSLKDVGDDLVVLVVNDGLSEDWERVKKECLALLQTPGNFKPVSNSVFAVHDLKNGTVWDRLDAKRMSTYDIAKVAFPPDTTLATQLKAVVTAWDEIVGGLNGRVPQRVVVLWINELEKPDMEPLRASPFKLEGLGKQQVFKFVWRGGSDGTEIRFLQVQGTGLEGIVYRGMKSPLKIDVE